MADACAFFQSGAVEDIGILYTAGTPSTDAGITPYLNVNVLSASVYKAYAPFGVATVPFFVKYPSL